MAQPQEKKTYHNRVPSLWLLKFRTTTEDQTNFVVAAKNVVHARKRMNNAFSSKKFAHSTFSDSKHDFSGKVESYNHSSEKWTNHDSISDMIKNAWLQPFSENMIAFST